MENTIKNKGNFLVQYYGQKVANIRHPFEDDYMGEVDGLFIDGINYLLLKSLSSITDEDAIEVAKLGFGGTKFSDHVEITKTTNRDFGFSFKILNHSCDRLEYMIDFNNFYHPTLICLDRSTSPKEYLHNVLKITDYLRSKGYALPWMGLSVEKLIEYGWIKLEK